MSQVALILNPSCTGSRWGRDTRAYLRFILFRHAQNLDTFYRLSIFFPGNLSLLYLMLRPLVELGRLVVRAGTGGWCGAIRGRQGAWRIITVLYSNTVVQKGTRQSRQDPKQSSSM